MELRSETHGKKFVLSLRPAARLEYNMGCNCYEIVDPTDDDILGDGRDPMDAWHAAAIELRTEAVDEASK